MALSDHLRELRARILKVALTLIVALVVALFFFDQLFDLVYGPYEEAVARLEDKQTLATTTGAGGGLMLYLKLCGFAALVATAGEFGFEKCSKASLCHVASGQAGAHRNTVCVIVFA